MAERDFSRRDLFRIAGQTAAGLVVAEMAGRLKDSSCLNIGASSYQSAEISANPEGGMQIQSVIFEAPKNRTADYLEPITIDVLDKKDPYKQYKIFRHKDAGAELSIPGVPRHYIDIDKKKGVPGQIVEPNAVVVHTTQGPGDNKARPAMIYYDYFQKNQIPRGGYGVATQFAVGKGGDAVQMAELFQNGVRRTYGCAGYPATIGIEMMEDNVYNSKREVPKGQYDRTIDIVKFCMDQYDIPANTRDASWKSSRDAHMSNFRPGVYGHYQLNPNNKTDPGKGLMRDILKDLKGYKKNRTYK